MGIFLKNEFSQMERKKTDKLFFFHSKCRFSHYFFYSLPRPFQPITVLAFQLAACDEMQVVHRHCNASFKKAV